MPFDPTLPFEEVEDEFETLSIEPKIKPSVSGFDPTQPFEEVESPEEQGILRQVADIPLGIARGGVTGIKMMTDILGADNPVSKSLSGVEGYMADLMSAQAKEDQQEISRIMKDAEDKGFGEQVKAGIKAFSIAPIDIMSQALGTMAPVIATGLAGSAAKLGALGMRAVQAGVGAGMGAGMIKGEIYNEVKNELVNSGIAEDAAEKAAVEAQSYGGKNLDQILLGAGLGAASTLGAEGIITRILTKQGTAPAAGVVSRVLKGGLTEAAPEAAQAAQEQLAKNVALQREGFDVDPSRGVVAAATMEAVAAAPLGGIAGAVERPAPIKTLAEENLEQTNEIARKVAENGAPLTASAIQDQAATNLRQDELAKQLEAQLEEELVAVKEPTAAAQKPMSKDEFKAIYSQVAPEELDAAEAGFTNTLATAATEEARANAQNALEAIKEVKATVTPPAPTVAPTIIPAVTPAVPTAQPPITDATQEIIQPEGVRQEPQDRVEVRPTTEAGVGDSLLGAERGQEEGQVVPAAPAIPEAITRAIEERKPISAPFALQYGVDLPRGWRYEDDFFVPPAEPAPAAEVPAVTPTPAAEVAAPAEPTIREVPEISPIVGAEPAAIVEQEPVAPVESAVEKPAAVSATTRNWELYSEELRGDLESFSAARGTGRIDYDLMDVADRFVEFAKNDTSGKPLSKLVTDFGKTDFDATATQIKKLRTSVKSVEQLEKAAAPASPTPVTEAVTPAPEVAPPAARIESVGENKIYSPIEISEQDTGAYHFGDGGIASDTTMQRMGAGRGTGHYGTGTYFLGKKEADVQREDRPMLNINLAGLNMAKPGRSAIRFHDMLRLFNKSVLQGEEIKFDQPADNGNRIFDLLDIALIGQVSGDRKARLKDAMLKVEGIFNSGTDDKLRTPSTYLMQELGFDGIDVRGTEADNTTYGSVVFAKPITPVTIPTVTEAVTPVTEAAPTPAGISVGNRIKLGKSPQTYTIEEVIPQSATERELGEQYYSVKNERTGETQVVEARDLKQVKGKGARKIAAAETEKAGLWATPPQEISSAATSINQRLMPSTFKRVEWKSGTRNADIGGGRFDNATEFLSKSGVENVIYDPYNRTQESNKAAVAKISGGQSDTATINNVLNVIAEPESRELVIRQAADAIKEDGKAYFLIYEGNAKGVGSQTKAGWQENRKAETYVDEISKHFGSVTRKGNLIIAEKPSKPLDVRRQAIDTTPEGILITPPDQQYTFEEVFDVAYDMFGGEIPEGFTIVNDSKDKDFEFKAAYIPESGEIVVNLAYLNKNDDIRDAITHELGHYIYGDPEFRAAFDQFIASLSPEARADLDAYVDTAYNKETGEIRLEEKMVRAFVDQFINEENAPAWRSMLDAIKRFLNKLGFKFNISDRDAISVFTAALDRYKAGEAISREGGARLMAAEPAPKRRKEQVGGAEREETRYITTPKGILSMNTDVLREKFFDGTSVSPEKTTQAWGYISRLLDIKSGNANEFAGEINDTVDADLLAKREAAIAAGEQVDPEEDVSKRIGAAMFSVELMNYAGRLAEQGDTRMLKFMIRNVNSMPIDKYAGDISNAARALRTRLEYDVSGFGAYNADQKGKVDRTAAIMFSTDKPSKEQFDAVNDALSDSEKTELGSPEEVAGDIENVEKRTGRSVVKKIEEKIKASTAPKKEELLISFQNLNQDRKFAGINITYKPQKIDPAKNIQNLIIGKLVDYRKTLVKQGADGLESTFWQTMSSKERKPGPLGELDQAQNNELAKIVQKTLIDLGLKGKPPNTKMTDIEKVAAILNEQRLGEEKKVAADKKIVEEIERRRSGELEGGGDSDAVNAKYDAILNAWNEAMSRQTNMPISDNMLQRLINSELKEQGSSVTELINEPYEDVLSQKKKGIVDSIIRRIYGVSKEAETGIEISEDYDNLSRYLKQTLENMLKLQAEKRDAAVARTLQRGLGDLPALPEAQKNKSQSIVQQDLRQQPDMGRREPWQNMLVGKLTQAGVAPEQAENIANLVWRQHEINDANRKIKEMKTAAEKGSLAVIIDRIKNTSLEKQQSPEWKQEVIKEYLRDAGLSSQAAETAAKLYDSIISERLAAAKQKAFEDTLNKTAPWKEYSSRNGKLAKNALKKIKEAIRTGVLDPEKNTESIIAALSGWTGFTKEQYQRIVQIDTILNDPDKDDVTKREAMDELNKIISKAKLPVSARDAIGPYYVAQALGGIPTATVNVASPLGFSIRNLMVDIAKYAKTDPARIPIAFDSFLDSMRSWYNQTAYAYKNQIYLNDVVEYLNGQNVLRELFDKGKQQWAEGKYAEGLKNMAIGMMQITGRVLSSLDQGAISMLENQNITRYAMSALENAKDKVPKKKIREFANMTLDLKRRVIAENIAAGMDKNRAGVLADLAVKSEIRAALSEFGVSYKDVLDSAVNDALQSVGRNKVITIEGVKKQQQNISDSGFLSYPPIKFLEWISSSAGKEGPAMQIFSKMVYGFAIVPARTFSTAAWFSPYGFLRLAIDKYKTNKGQESPYAMSLQTEAQYRQRLTESIAGSIAMLALFAMRSGSSDDEDDKLFKLVITGNGPNATTDKQYYDTWIKNHKPYSIELHFGDSKATINIGRGGEALFFPIMLAGALDDWEIKKKQNLTKKEPSDLNIATELLGSAFFALAQRGPYAAFTEPLFDASKQGRVTENLVGQLGYFGKTFIPVLGTSITRNISDFINDPVDRSSIEGALYANTPIVGPWIGTKALNALGQPIRADDFSDKLFKLGVPVVFSFPKNTPENALNELILKQGSGPTLPTRANAQKRFGDVLTDKEFETYVREYGRVMSDKMFKNRTRLANMKAVDYDDELEKYARGYSIDGIKIKGASDSAVLAVKRMRQ